MEKEDKKEMRINTDRATWLRFRMVSLEQGSADKALKYLLDTNDRLSAIRIKPRQ